MCNWFLHSPNCNNSKKGRLDKIGTGRKTDKQAIVKKVPNAQSRYLIDGVRQIVTENKEGTL